VKKSSLFWLLVAAIPVSVAVQISWFGIYTFVDNYIVRGLGHSNEEWTASALWLTGGMIVWPFICTEIAARIGRRATVTVAIGITGGFYLCMAFVKSLLLINLLLALVAFPVSVSTAVWLPLVAEVGRDLPGRSLTLAQFVSAGMGAVMLVAGGVLIRFFDYFKAFLFFGLLSMLCAVIFHFVSRKLSEEHSSDVVSFRHFSRQDLRFLLTGSLLLILFLGTGTEPFNYLTVNQLFANLAGDQHHLGIEAIGLIVGLGRLPALITLLLVAQFVDRVNAQAGYGLGIAAVGVFVVTMGHAVHTGGFIASYACYFLFQGIVWGTSIPAINAAVHPRVRDSAFAVLGVISTVMLFLMGSIHNRMLHAGISLPHVFVICGCGAIVGGLLMGIISLLKPPRMHRPARSVADETAVV